MVSARCDLSLGVLWFMKELDCVVTGSTAAAGGRKPCLQSHGRRWATRSACVGGNLLLQLFIPQGFAHGICGTSEFAEIDYKCSDYYDPDD
jgi:hypothetical protein